MCDTGHDDPGLHKSSHRKAGRGRLHRTHIARKSGARQIWGRCLFQNQCVMRCHRMSSGETTQHMPLKKKVTEDDSV